MKIQILILSFTSKFSIMKVLLGNQILIPHFGSASKIKFIIYLFFTFIVILSPKDLASQVHSRPDIYSFNPTERCELRNLMVTFLDLGGGSVVLEHNNPTPLAFQDIHCYNEFFLSWHREYIRRLEEWLLTQNGGSKYVPLPEWDPATSIPCEFFNNTCSTCPGSAIATGFNNMNNQNPFGYDFSRFLNSATLCNYSSGTMTDPQWGKTRFGSAADNFSLDLQAEHNSPHVQIGGVMGTGVSPAAAIFWLWHGYVDDIYRKYQCDCQNDTPKDLYIAATNEDIGEEPYMESTGNLIYLSPEIWVRNNQDVIGSDGRYTEEDNPLRHENPEAGQNNYIYVRIRNIGCQQTQAGEVNLRVYYSKASTGLQWSTHWVNYMVGGITYGDEITATPVSIPAIDPGEQYVAEIQWFPPDPAVFGEIESHFCLLGRLESTVDPMTFVETSSVAANTRNNNNIAWKNVTIVDIDPFNFTTVNLPEFVFEVIQPINSTDPIKLDFSKIGNFNLSRVFLKATPEVMDTFLTQGTPQFMELIDEPGTGDLVFDILSDSASIGNLTLLPGQTVPLKLKFDLKCSPNGGFPCAKYGDVYRYEVKQSIQGVFGDEFVGANGYELRIKQSAETICNSLISDSFVELPTCENTPTGLISLSLSGQSPYTFYWSNGDNTQEISDLLPGKYDVVVVDGNNCVDTMSFILNDQSDLQIEFEANSPFCATPNGNINSSVSGGTQPYSYLWSNGSQESSISGLGLGIYYLTVTDSEGCQRTDSVKIGTTMLLGGFTFSTNASGSNGNDGSAYVSPTGGVPPYTYNWSNGENTDTISNLNPADYAVTVTDELGCTFVDTVTVDFVNSTINLTTENDLFKLSPNPAKDEILITLKNWKPIALNIVISDVSGRVIQKINKSIFDNSILLDLKEFPTGIYYLTLSDQEISVTEKFIKIE